MMLIAKTFFAHEIPDDPIEIVTNSISSFPSGHAMMGTIFYMTLAVTISRRQHSHKTKRFTLISGIVISIFNWNKQNTSRKSFRRRCICRLVSWYNMALFMLDFRKTN